MGYYGKLPPLPDEGIRMKNGVLHYTPYVEVNGVCVSFEFGLSTRRSCDYGIIIFAFGFNADWHCECLDCYRLG